MAKRSDADRVEKLETDARTLRSVAKALEAHGQPANLLRDAAHVKDATADHRRGAS